MNILKWFRRQLWPTSKEFFEDQKRFEKEWFEQASAEFSIALKWTRERPKIPGYYWIRTPLLSQRISHFYFAHGQDWLTSSYTDFGTRYSHYGQPAEYAGPIPAPAKIP